MANFNTRFNSLESNFNSLHEAVALGFEKLQKQLDKKAMTNQDFSHQYFILPQSDDPDCRLVDSDHAELLIDGITGVYLNTEDKNSTISRFLREFSSFRACRWKCRA